MLSNSFACYREMVHKKKSQLMAAHFTIVLFLETATTISAFSHHHPDQLAAFNMEARPSTSKKIMTH